jgi:hypothetical protein
MIMLAGLLEEPRISICSRARDDSRVSNTVLFSRIIGSYECTNHRSERFYFHFL